MDVVVDVEVMVVVDLLDMVTPDIELELLELLDVLAAVNFFGSTRVLEPNLPSSVRNW